MATGYLSKKRYRTVDCDELTTRKIFETAQRELYLYKPEFKEYIIPQ